MKNFNQGAVNIEYQYKVNNLSGTETSTVKNTFYLKDVELFEELSSNSYPTKFSINIKNFC